VSDGDAIALLGQKFRQQRAKFLVIVDNKKVGWGAHDTDYPNPGVQIWIGKYLGGCIRIARGVQGFCAGYVTLCNRAAG
jgi:hypothetical protein